MSISINQEKLKIYTNAYILYELAANGVDPRESLDSTTFRVKGQTGEGYKYDVYEKYHQKLFSGKPYVEIFLEAFPGVNLASYHQRQNIEEMIKVEGPEQFEVALADLYEGNDDAATFQKIVDFLGASFDVLGFIFFLKDCEKYMPIRSRLFNERFKLLDFDSDLAGNCNWEKHQEYNEWIKEIQDFLVSNVNKDITLLDAHSFVWILPKAKKYLDQEVQIVEHKKFGKGVVVGIDDENITAHFANERDNKKFVKQIALSKGLLKLIWDDKTFRNHYAPAFLQMLHDDSEACRLLKLLE